MAKKNKKGFRIPKEIGGIKVPKEARRAGEALIDKANSPEGRQILMSGLAMAATAAAAAAARSSRPEAAAAKPTGDATRQETQVDPHKVVDAIGDAASAFMSSLFAGSRK